MAYVCDSGIMAGVCHAFGSALSCTLVSDAFSSARFGDGR